jgi:hypothetical protein
MEEVSRLAKISASLKEALHHRSFEAGKFLIELEEEADYGQWKTFENYVQSECRIKVRTARRLMFAHRIRELLKAHGRLLPVSEGSVRPLSEELREDRQQTKIKLTLEELQLKAWDIACLMKQKSTPTGIDVRRAVRRLMGPKVDMLTDPAFRAYRRHFHRIKTELATATKRMPDLAAFLEGDDKKTNRQKKEMAKLIEKMAMSLNRHASTFSGTWEPDQQLFEKGDYLAALSRVRQLESKVASLERMTVILRVHDWFRRSGFKEIAESPSPPVSLPNAIYVQSLEMWARTVAPRGV